MARLKLDDSLAECLRKMADKNPEVVHIVFHLTQLDEHVAPPIGGGVAMIWLDEWGIYGDDIAQLYHAVCLDDVEDLYWMVRAAQVGTISQHELKRMIRFGSNENMQEIIDKTRDFVLKDLKEIDDAS